MTPSTTGRHHGAKRPAETRAQRAVNLGLAALALLITLPLWLVVAIAVKATSPGPVIYSQVRIGQDRRGCRRDGSRGRRRVRDLGGRPFTIYKFRTMYVDAEARTGAVWAERNDPRVTPVGRFLRASRLDELPQLLNVLRGDMNIVGPRPERPSIFAELREQIPDYALRQRARPGITGLAQISQGYDSSLDDVRRKVSFDLAYLDRASLGHDLAIMLRTIPVMIQRKSGW